jgi:hypothetical protein
MRLKTFSQFINEQTTSVYSTGMVGKEVEKIQQKLIDLKLLNAKSPDGKFGPNTKAAVIKFQEKNGLEPDGIVGAQTYPKLMGAKTTTTVQPSKKDFSKVDLSPKVQVAQSDTFKPYSDQASRVATITQKQITDFRANITLALKNSLGIPAHLRALIHFLNGRTDAFTNSDLTQEEQKTLGQMIAHAIRKGKFKSGASLDFYDLAGQMNTDGERFNFKDSTLGVDQLNIQNMTTRIGMTLGNATVTKVANGYLVTDQYDYNNYYNHPEKYTLSEAPSTILQALKKLGSKNYVQGIEALLSFAHKAGYPGYPVKIGLPEGFIKGAVS